MTVSKEVRIAELGEGDFLERWHFLNEKSVLPQCVVMVMPECLL
jgi:hypothetical protein